MGQKHTSITADQPLYSRGNELVWANPIFIMGGLHICFNFLKAIGNHMENAGLDDPLTEAGVYYAAGHINRIRNAFKLQKLQILSLYEHYT